MARYCGSDSQLSVTASGVGDAWSVGLAGCGADVRHWDGTAWHRVLVPPRTMVTEPAFFPSAPVAASSGRDAWIFPRAGTLLAPNRGWALHWNGLTWQKLALPDNLVVAAAVAFSPADAWAFGGVQRGPDPYALRAPYAARYDGRAWHAVIMPGRPLAVSALSPRDIWAVGPALGPAGKPTSRLVAMHWTGRAWQDVPVPAIAGEVIGVDFASPPAAAATGPRGLWWAYPVLRPTRAVHVVLLRWDGTSWHRVTVPAGVTDAGAMAQDGHGGLWLCPDSPARQYCYHYA